MEQSLITFKIKYETDIESKSIILKMIKNYNSLLKFTYNRVQEGITSTKDLTQKQKEMNNIFLDSHFKNSSIFEAKALKNKKIVFGGKKLFTDRSKQLISKEDFEIKRLVPLCSIGESPAKGNRKFQLIKSNEVLFKPSKDIHISLNLINLGRKRIKELNELIKLQNSKIIPITYKLDLEYVYISFDYSKIKQNSYKTKENRVLAIDMNPNYLGYSIVDWKNENNYFIVDKGVFDIKSLNDKEFELKKIKKLPSESCERKYFKNKRDYETTKIAYKIANLCKHFKCEICSIEDLNMKSKDQEKGKRNNKLVNNQWNRNKFENILTKLLNCSSTKLIKINPAYSSILGNLIYREEKLPDMILSSIEIGRRGIEFQNQYLLNRKERKKNIVLPDFNLVKERISKSLEELNIFSQIKNYEELFSVLKKSKVKYRFLLSEIDSARVFSKFYKKSYIKLYKFI